MYHTELSYLIMKLFTSSPGSRASKFVALRIGLHCSSQEFNSTAWSRKSTDFRSNKCFSCAYQMSESEDISRRVRSMPESIFIFLWLWRRSWTHWTCERAANSGIQGCSSAIIPESFSE